MQLPTNIFGTNCLLKLTIKVSKKVIVFIPMVWKQGKISKRRMKNDYFFLNFCFYCERQIE